MSDSDSDDGESTLSHLSLGDLVEQKRTVEVQILAQLCKDRELKQVVALHEKCEFTPAEVRIAHNAALRAACSNRLEIVQWLIATFALNAADMRAKKCETLLNACSAKRADIVAFLLKSLSDADVLCDDAAAFCSAVKYAPDIALLILQRCPDDMVASHTKTLLDPACSYNRKELVAYILQRGLRSEVRQVADCLLDYVGWWDGEKTDRADIIYMILQKIGVDRVSKALLYVSRMGHDDALANLLPGLSKETLFLDGGEALMLACSGGHRFAVERLVDLVPHAAIVASLGIVARTGNRDILSILLGELSPAYCSSAIVHARQRAASWGHDHLDYLFEDKLAAQVKDEKSRE